MSGGRLAASRDDDWKDWLWDIGDKTLAQAQVVSGSLEYRLRLGLGDRRGGARKLALSVRADALAFATSVRADPDARAASFKAARLHLARLVVAVLGFLFGQTVGAVSFNAVLPKAAASTTAVVAALTVAATAHVARRTKLLGPSQVSANVSAAAVAGLVFGSFWGVDSGALLLLLSLSQLGAAVVVGERLHPELRTMLASGLALVLGSWGLRGPLWGLRLVGLWASVLQWDILSRWSLREASTAYPPAFVLPNALFLHAVLRAALY